jgi:hypothetical protein
MRLFNQTIPAELGGVVLKALAKEPGARYQSAAAMEVALLESDADQLGPATRIQAAREETATQREGSGTEPERPLIPSSMNIGQLAGFRARLAAGLGDWLILLVPVAILLALARLTNADALAGLVILLIPIEAIAYFVFFWHRHQTPAMKVLHLELAGPEESGGSATGRLCCAASAIW